MRRWSKEDKGPLVIHIGQRNLLTVVKDREFGVFLDDENGGEILLPNRDVPENCEIGSQVEVFLYYDSEDRLIATTEHSLAMVGEFALLKVVAVEAVGAFLDWGLPKDLFLPFAEQSRDLRPGDEVLVFVYLDKSSRISASMRLEKNTDKQPGNYEEGQSVELLIIGRTDLGYKAIIEGRHLGVIYSNEVFQKISYGQRLPGFIKKIREDGKIDLSLQKTGHAAADETAVKIMDLLKSSRDGFLAINDKTSAETIHGLFGVSKKKYKVALGGLYKKRLILVKDDGIYLAKD